MIKSKGFTLLETIIYLALFAIITGAASAAVYAIIESSGRSQAKVNLQEEGDFLVAKINWALTGSQTILASSSPESLTINKYVSASNPLVFDSDGINLRLKEGTGQPAVLNSSSVSVSNLSFQQLPASNGGPTGVKTDFTLTTLTANRVNLSQNFETTKYLR